MKQVLIAGTSITAEIIESHLRGDDRYEVKGFVVDDEFINQSNEFRSRTVGLSDLLNTLPPQTHRVIMAIGYGDLNRNRQSMFHRLKEMGYEFETYIHPQAMVHTDHPRGEGSVVLPGAVIDPHVRLGANTMVWSNATLAHHSSVGDHCWVATGAMVSGQARIADNVFLGVNSTVVNEVSVGEFSLIGAAGLITRDTKPYSVHFARSAETMRYSAEEYTRYYKL